MHKHGTSIPGLSPLFKSTECSFLWVQRDDTKISCARADFSNAPVSVSQSWPESYVDFIIPAGHKLRKRGRFPPARINDPNGTTTAAAAVDILPQVVEDRAVSYFGGQARHRIPQMIFTKKRVSVIKLRPRRQDYDSGAASSNSWNNDDDDDDGDGNKCDVYARNRKSYFPTAIDSNYGGILA